MKNFKSFTAKDWIKSAFSVLALLAGCAVFSIILGSVTSSMKVYDLAYKNTALVLGVLMATSTYSIILYFSSLSPRVRKILTFVGAFAAYLTSRYLILKIIVSPPAGSILPSPTQLEYQSADNWAFLVGFAFIVVIIKSKRNRTP